MADNPAFDAITEQILSGDAPLNIRTAAARGALPLPRPTLVRLFVHLLGDGNESVRETATSSLEGLEDDAIADSLAQPDCTPEVLAHFTGQALGNETIAEKIVFHGETPAAAMRSLAKSGSAAVVELVLTNQERLLREPALLDGLMANPALRVEQQGRILELIERLASFGAGGAAEGAEATDRPLDDVELDAEAAAELLEVDVGDLLSASEILGGEEFETSESPAVRGMYQRILQLSPAQKALLAMKGGREERSILVRDTNKVVSLGVLKNPRITQLEVEAIARLRNVTDEVLRRVGGNREWVKSYAVIHALVTNPRTPQGVATNFITRLTNRDLKELARSREVPELIRRMARRTHDLRTQKSGSLLKGKK